MDASKFTKLLKILGVEGVQDIPFGAIHPNDFIKKAPVSSQEEVTDVLGGIVGKNTIGENGLPIPPPMPKKKPATKQQIDANTESFLKNLGLPNEEEYSRLSDSKNMSEIEKRIDFENRIKEGKSRLEMKQRKNEGWR